MFPGEAPAPRRSARLIKHRRTLRRGLAKVDAGHLEVPAFMADRVDLVRIGKHAPSPIAQHRAVLPASFPRLVADLHILVGDVVAVVVCALPAKANILGAAIEIGGDDVPASAALREMVQRREAARERVGVLERERRSEPKAEILGHQSHRGHKLQWIVDGDLRGVTKGSVEVAMVDVIDAKDVGDEKAVELAALQNLGELDPIFEILVLPRTVARMSPKPWRLMPDAVHVEGVESDLASHVSPQIAP